jgi:hypothetical protein
MREFWSQWFNGYSREVGNPKRWFIREAEELINFIETKNPPFFMSVNPFRDRNQVYGIEKLFFDFDHPEPHKAWVEAKDLVKNLESRGLEPLMVYSGRKGYHVYIYLKEEIGVDLPEHKLKALYGVLQKVALNGQKYETLDPAVMGDIKRLARVPYTVHEKSGRHCIMVDTYGGTQQIMDLEKYREGGLGLKQVYRALELVNKEEKTKKIVEARSKAKHIQAKTEGKTYQPKGYGPRPCIFEALENGSLQGGDGHLMRLAIVAELRANGWDKNRIIEAFNHTPDFNRKITDEQVTHAVKKGYTPFKCDTIKSLGYCIREKCSLYR